MEDAASAAAYVGAGLALVALITAWFAVVGLRRLRADQKKVLGPSGESDLVAHAATLQREFEALHGYVEDVLGTLDGRLAVAEQRLDGAIAKRAMVRYDAYNEMSGRQSTTVALLDAHGSGVLLSSIHHRDQARVYAKHVVAGTPDLPLSPEEQEAVRLATDAPTAADGPRGA